MRSLTDEPGRGGTSPARKELNQHMHSKHGRAKLTGDTFQRLVAHEEMHQTQQWDHVHDDYELPALWRAAVKDA